MEAQAGKVIMKEAQNQCCDEKTGGRFSPVIGMYNDILFSKEEQRTDNHADFLDDNQDDCGPGEYIAPTVADQGRNNQQFICKRIHQFTEGRNLIVFSGEISVEHVGQARKTENTEGLIGMAVEVQQNEKRHENQTEHG